MPTLPDRFVPQHVRFRFTQLECVTTGEDGPAEPYLWILFYKIDADGFRFGTQITGIEGTPVVKTHAGNAISANVGREDWRSMMAGGIVDIPVQIGEWKTPVLPMRAPSDHPDIFRGGDIVIPGLFGFVVALMEQDTSGGAARVEAHAKLNELVSTSLKEYIEGTPLNQLMEGMPKEEQDAMTDGIGFQLAMVYLKHMQFWDYPDFDDVIGMVSRTYVAGPLPPVIVRPDEPPPKQKQLSLDGSMRNTRYLSFGVIGPQDDTDEKREARTANGEWHIGVEYEVHPMVQYVPLGDAVDVKVFDGDNGDQRSLTLVTLGRQGVRGTVDVFGVQRTFVTHRFDAADLGELNNAIGSIEIPGGYKVVLFEKPGFQGRSLTLDRASVTGARFSLHRFFIPPPMDERPRLGAPPETWNNRISSIEVVIEDVSGFIH